MALLITDPVDIALDDDGDLDITAVSGIRFASGIEGVAQLIRIAILMIRGEWFLNLDAGVPWMPGVGVDEATAILGQPYDELRARSEIRAAITSVEGVASITRLDLEFDATTRTLAVSWEVLTVFGDTVEDELERSA